MKNQEDLLESILRWLRYVQERRISDLFGTENQKDIFVKPEGFPVVPELDVDLSSLDIDNLRRSVAAFQRRRKHFQSAITKTTPGFYINFLSKRFFFAILEKYFVEHLNLDVKVSYLEVPGLDHTLNVDDSVRLYKSGDDLTQWYELMQQTNVFLECFKFSISDGMRTMSVKCFSYKDIITLWLPTFQGDIIKKSSEGFYRFVGRLPYEYMFNIESGFLSGLFILLNLLVFG